MKARIKMQAERDGVRKYGVYFPETKRTEWCKDLPAAVKVLAAANSKNKFRSVAL